MRKLYESAKQTVVDEILRTGKELNIPQTLQPQIMKSIQNRLQIKRKITKSDIKNTIKYMKYTNDLKNYTTKNFFDKSYYGFPLELLRGFDAFIDYAYENKIIPKLMKSKKMFETFPFNNRDEIYNFISLTIVLPFYIVLLKYKSKMFLLLYDMEEHNLHFALPISEDY